jgi:hypothetical protein
MDPSSVILSLQPDLRFGFPARRDAVIAAPVEFGGWITGLITPNPQQRGDSPATLLWHNKTFS